MNEKFSNVKENMDNNSANPFDSLDLDIDLSSIDNLTVDDKNQMMNNQLCKYNP